MAAPIDANVAVVVKGQRNLLASEALNGHWLLVGVFDDILLFAEFDDSLFGNVGVAPKEGRLLAFPPIY